MILTMENYVYIQTIKVKENKPKHRNICFGALQDLLLSSPHLHLQLLHIFQNLFNKYITFVKNDKL